MRNHRNTKVRMILVCEMERQIIEKSNGESNTTYVQDNAYFQSRTHINLEKTDVKVFIKEMIIEILGNLIIYQKKGSGWYFKEVISLEIHIVEYKPMRGGTYIPFPEFIKKKTAITNIKNEDDKCFLWSVLRYLHPVQKNGERINDLKKYENDLNFKGINFPVKVKDIQKFENNNPDLPGINVFSVNDNNKIYPLRHNQKDCQKSIDLFLYSEDEKQHYSLIKNFTRLVRSQYTSHRSSKIYICKKCLTHFTKEDLLEKHISYCSKNETVAVKMPTKNSILKFQNHFKKLPIPFAIYADFECFTIPVNSCQPNPNKSFTQGYQKHEPSGYCLNIKALDGINTNFKPIVYTKKTPDEDISKRKKCLTQKKEKSVLQRKKCLTHFTKEDLLEKHISYCSKNETVAVKMPTKNSILKFQNHFKKLPIPFAIYADFECFTIPVNSCQPNPNKSFTQGYQKHEPSGYCLNIKALDGINTNFKPIVYTKKTPDEDISKKFIKHVTKLTLQIYQNYYKNPKTMIFNSEDQEDFVSARYCHICEKKLFRDKITEKILKVRDHCHFTGEYRGAAHNECNLNCKKPLILPVIFHNLQGYDSHLFLKQLAKVSGDLSTIPSTEEKYISFSKRITVDHYYSKNMGKLLPKKFEIRFIDSFKFLQTSLSKLVENLQSSDFKNLNEEIKNNSSLLTRKGVYPYDYVTSINNLKETKTSIKR